MGNAHTVDAAHVTGGTGRDEHVSGGEGFWWGVQIQQALLCLKHHAVLGFVVNLDLRMVRAHMTLRTSAGQAGDSDRTGVPCMASGAVADGTVAVGLADAVALVATASHRGRSLRLHKRVRWPAASSRLICFRKIHLLGTESFLTVDGCP